MRQVYEKYDFNKDGQLDIGEFKKLMDKIESGLSEDDIRLCFRRFDLDDDKRISFEEFYRTLCKISGDPSHVFVKHSEVTAARNSTEQNGSKEL